MPEDWSGKSSLLILKLKDTCCKNIAEIYGKYSKI